MREPEIAYAFGMTQPFSLTSGPAGHSWNRTSLAQIRLGKGATERRDKRNKKHYFHLQTFECLKQVTVYYMATWPEW
jgi:hypothetical protein